MAILATRTIFDAVKPVGEEIPLAFVCETLINAEDDYIFDYVVNNDVVVTGLELTKTVDACNADLAVTAIVQKKPAGGGAVVEIARCVLPATSPCGTKIIAGAVVGSLIYNDAAAVVTDPLIKVVAQSGVVKPTQQKVRLIIRLNGGRVPGAAAASCFVKISLARQSGLTNDIGQGSNELYNVTPAV